MRTPQAVAGADGDFQDTFRLAGRIDGWLSEGQAHRLWDAARRVVAPGRIVEIGSFHGRSTTVLASAASEGVELIAIDPHGGGDRGPQEIAPDAQRGDEDFAAFHENLRQAGVSERVRHVRLSSDAALDSVEGSIDVLYVDGAHRYGPARTDLEHWGARVAPHGTMLIHDSFNAVGVTLAQLRLLFFSRAWRYLGRSRSLAEYRRERLASTAVIGNALRQLLAMPYFVRNAIVKVLLLIRLRPLTRLLGHREANWPY
jgi:predicted O-methyltransferase YrrM